MAVIVRRDWQTKPRAAVLDTTDRLARGLYHWWLCGEGGGTLIQDMMRRKHGTLSSSALWKAGPTGISPLYTGSPARTTFTALDSTWNSVDRFTLCYWGKKTATNTTIHVANRIAGNFAGLYLTHYSNNIVYAMYGSVQYGQYTLSDAKLHHYCMVFDGTESTDAAKLKLYIDGIQVALSIRTPGLAANTGNSNTNPFYIGYDTANNEYSQGCIDNVRLYKRPLQAAEVRELYVRPYAGLVRPGRKFIFPEVPNTGTANLTSGPATLSAAGTVAIVGSLVKTLAAATLSALGAVDIIGSASLAAADATLSALATVLVEATANLTADDATLSAEGSLPIDGNASITTEDATLSAEGVLLLSALANLVAAAATLTATGEVAVVGTASITLEDAVLSAFGGSVAFGDADLLAGPATLFAEGFVTDPDYNPAWNPTDKGLIVRRAEDAHEDFRFSPWGLMAGQGMAFLSRVAGRQTTHTRLNESGIMTAGPSYADPIDDGNSLEVGLATSTFFLLVLRPDTGGFAIYVFAPGGITLLPGLGSAEFVVGTPGAGEIGANTGVTYHTLDNNTGDTINLWVMAAGV